MSRHFIGFELPNPLQELLCSSLLEQSKQRGAQGLGGTRGDLVHIISLVDVAASDRRELDILMDVGRGENTRKVTVGHQQLRHEVDVPVMGPAVFLPRLLPSGDIAVLLEQLLGVLAEVPDKSSHQTKGRSRY